jgi:hypothetical protein
MASCCHGKKTDPGEIDIGPLLKAFAALDEALRVARSRLEKDGAIQRFEYTFELLWKTLRWDMVNLKDVERRNP